MKIEEAEIEKYFCLIDEDYMREVASIGPSMDIQTDFKIAYLILFFQLSKREGNERGILLGDLFISILTGRLISRDRELLSRIIQKISRYHSEIILKKSGCYKRELLLLMREVSHAKRAV